MGFHCKVTDISASESTKNSKKTTKHNVHMMHYKFYLNALICILDLDLEDNDLIVGPIVKLWIYMYQKVKKKIKSYIMYVAV